jgi:hypothetical protein
VAVAEPAPQRRGRRGSDHVGGDPQETSVTLPSSPAIVGRAVARIVWSSTAGNIAATMAANGSATALASGGIGETVVRRVRSRSHVHSVPVVLSQ